MIYTNSEKEYIASGYDIPSCILKSLEIRGWSISRLAMLVGVNRSTIGRFINGETENLKENTIDKIYVILGLDFLSPPKMKKN